MEAVEETLNWESISVGQEEDSEDEVKDGWDFDGTEYSDWEESEKHIPVIEGTRPLRQKAKELPHRKRSTPAPLLPYSSIETPADKEFFEKAREHMYTTVESGDLEDRTILYRKGAGEGTEPTTQGPTDPSMTLSQVIEESRSMEDIRLAHVGVSYL